ncbi:hypothetical protein BCR44DRAFT_63862 [Catenaria anguillulae PL171]|uniref:Peptidase M20 dimerisation domain-containing protein n=1 Tax=Catenaria anguillulae PL171 TaxID=765915 RepID=A0A1Y2I3T6_9FUNG|nr:hypothetical protein BCR44DRAFT_63862 [Catenaria anguillulae PL171]
MPLPAHNSAPAAARYTNGSATTPTSPGADPGQAVHTLTAGHAISLSRSTPSAARPIVLVRKRSARNRKRSLRSSSAASSHRPSNLSCESSAPTSPDLSSPDSVDDVDPALLRDQSTGRSQSHASPPTAVLNGPDQSMTLAHTLDVHAFGSLGSAGSMIPVSVAISHAIVALGCQTGEILLFDPVTFQHKSTLVGHTRAVLSMSWASPADIDSATSTPRLISTSADGTSRMWAIERQEPRAETVIIASDPGSLYSAASDPATGAVFLGCQNTSLQWFFPSNRASSSSATSEAKSVLQAREFSYFFQSRKLHAFLTQDERKLGTTHVSVVSDAHVIPHAHIGYVYALAMHPSKPWLFTGAGDGLVKVWDVSGAAHLTPTVLRTIRIAAAGAGDSGSTATPSAADFGVVSLAVSPCGATLYVGCQGGTIAVWDLETGQCIRRLIEHTDDVVSLHVVRTDPSRTDAMGDRLVSTAMDGSVRVWALHDNYACLATVGGGRDATAIISASVDGDRIATVDELGHCHIWHAPVLSESIPAAAASMDVQSSISDLVQCASSAACDSSTSTHLSDFGLSGAEESAPHMVDAMLFALRGWLPYKTVSGDPQYASDCRAGAQYLRSILAQVGAEASLLPGAPGRNPLVLGRFHPASSAPAHDSPSPPAPEDASPPQPIHIVYYAHYDVVPASRDQWATDPFTLTGKNGILYGRGVSDDKGPILAAIFAVAELAAAGQLHATVTFLIEGEEESGSVGLQEAVDAHADQILGAHGGADVIVMSNSSWLGNQVPCLVYGQRGVVHATVTVKDVSGTQSDKHAGVEGGAVHAEPLPDLVHLLAQLTDPRAPRDRRVKVPGFYDGVPSELAEDEDRRYDELVARIMQEEQTDVQAHVVGCAEVAAGRAHKIKQSLVQKWQTPTLTMSRVTTSVGGGESKTVIPHKASATISLRTVPGQDTAQLVASLREYLEDTFAELQEAQGCGGNALEIDVTTAADWWESSPSDPSFDACARAIKNVWGIHPLFVREGGSTLPLHWLRRRLAGPSRTTEVPIVNVPLAQASDRAHLSNECIAVRNLIQGRKVLRESIRNLQEQLL